MENEGEKLSKMIKGAGLAMGKFADQLGMTRQNLRYHLKKKVLDEEFKAKIIKAFAEVLPNDKSLAENGVYVKPQNGQYFPPTIKPLAESNEAVANKSPIQGLSFVELNIPLKGRDEQAHLTLPSDYTQADLSRVKRFVEALMEE